jgi:hypothetical protein
MTPEEQKDLDALHKEQTNLREHFSSYVRHILDMGPEELKHSGHKTVEEALVYAAKSHIKDLDKLVKAHIKKWPDK